MKFLAGRDFPTDNPFDQDPLRANPVFLYSEMTAPLPCASMAGIWTAYPNPNKAAAHLRFGLMPCDFSIWLCRDEWDPSPKQPKLAEDIFAATRTAGNRYIADIPIMERIIATLDASINTKDDEVAWRVLEKACRAFNTRWASTPTWNFEHRPRRDVSALLRDMAKKRAIDPHDDQIRAIAASAPSRATAQRDLRSLLRDTVIC